MNWNIDYIIIYDTIYTLPAYNRSLSYHQYPYTYNLKIDLFDKPI